MGMRRHRRRHRPVVNIIATKATVNLTLLLLHPNLQIGGIAKLMSLRAQMVDRVSGHPTTDLATAIPVVFHQLSANLDLRYGMACKESC